MQYQYQVPQFIDVEDKIIGPLTLKQFAFVAVGAVITFFLFFILKVAYAILLGLPLMAISIALPFARIDGMPLWKYLIAMIAFARRPQEYLWKE